MRALVQRVSSASVAVDGEVMGSIGRGLLVFAGVTHSDTEETAKQLAAKIVGLRLFEDGTGKMNLSLREIEGGGGVLCISQFTLYGDLRRGNRPSFTDAAPPAEAEPLYLAFCEAIASHGVPVERGVFGAHMEVSLVNDGPVTFWLDSAGFERPRNT